MRSHRILAVACFFVATACLGEDSLKQIDQVFQAYDKPGSPGCSLGVIRDGEFVYRRGYGLGSLELAGWVLLRDSAGWARLRRVGFWISNEAVFGTTEVMPCYKAPRDVLNARRLHPSLRSHSTPKTPIMPEDTYFDHQSDSSSDLLLESFSS